MASDGDGDGATAHADGAAYWQRKRHERRARVRAAAVARRAAQQAEWQSLDAAAQAERKAAAALAHERRRAAAAAHDARCRANLHDARVPTLVFDLSLAWCMNVADTRSAVAQVKLSYSALRRAAFVLRPVLVCTAGREGDANDNDANDDNTNNDNNNDNKGHDVSAQAAVLATLHDFDGFRRYPPHMTRTQHWSTLYDADRVVVLTADADEVLDDVAPATVYVVGAFVDHNRHKGLMRRTAERHARVRMARLPLQETLAHGLGNRCKVLTINHVTDVLVTFVQLRDAQTSPHNDGNTSDAGDDRQAMLRRCWAAAFDAVLPTRRLQPQPQASATSLRRRPRHDGNEDDDDGSCSN